MGDANPGFVPLQQKNMAMHRNRSPNEQASLAFARRRVYHPECDQPSHEEMLEIAQQDGFTDFDEASKEYYLCAYKAHPEMEELMETYSTYTATMHFDFVSGALKATRYKKSDANLLLSKVQKLLAEFYSVCSTQILQVLKECKFDTSWAESLLRDDAFVFYGKRFWSTATLAGSNGKLSAEDITQELRKMHAAGQLGDWFNNDVLLGACEFVQQGVGPMPVIKALAQTKGNHAGEEFFNLICTNDNAVQDEEIENIMSQIETDVTEEATRKKFSTLLKTMQRSNDRNFEEVPGLFGLGFDVKRLVVALIDKKGNIEDALNIVLS